MARLPRLHAPGVPHYVAQRAAAERALFADDEAYRTFVALLADAVRAHGVALHAYVLLPDEIRFVATPKRRDVAAPADADARPSLCADRPSRQRPQRAAVDRALSIDARRSRRLSARRDAARRTAAADAGDRRRCGLPGPGRANVITPDSNSWRSSPTTLRTGRSATRRSSGRRSIAVRSKPCKLLRWRNESSAPSTAAGRSATRRSSRRPEALQAGAWHHGRRGARRSPCP